MDFTPEFVELITQRRNDLKEEIAVILPEPRPIVLEIGSGHGHFLTRYSTENPGKLCIGVDLRSDRIQRALRKSKRAHLLNCHFVRTEALEFINALPAGVTFDEIWVLFPDPWPKKRHHKNRLLQPDFFEAIAARSPQGTPLYFRTDHVGYFESIKVLVPSLNTWKTAANAAWPMEHETVFQARADAYQSLVAVRTSHPARLTEKVASGLPPPAKPTSAA